MSLDLDSILDALAARVAAKLPVPAEHALEHAFMKRATFAKRIDVSERTVDGLIARGLPCIGKGRLLRVDVARADVWLRDHLGDDAPETQADEDPDAALARKNASRGSR